MSYRVKEVFATIQGEGRNAGTAAVFVRLAGCNMWNGNEEDRVRDAARNGAECPKWCDTDFVGGHRYTAIGLAYEVANLALRYSDAVTFVVITGGEPLLQVDDALLAAFRRLCPWMTIAIETNGSVRPQWSKDNPDAAGIWTTMSPKTSRDRIALTEDEVSELKLVFPAYEPLEWEDFDAEKYLQPQADMSILSKSTTVAAIDYVMTHPSWKLSIQTHKVIGVR